MVSVDEAVATILEDASALEAEEVELNALTGRVVASDIKARMTQPPFAASAMDGYAVRFSDAARGARLTVIGEAPAGAPFPKPVGSGEAVRIFTGGAIPDGADHVVIQEDVERHDDKIEIREPQSLARNIRNAGIDFKKDDTLVRAGDAFHEIHGSILAAANIDSAPVIRKPCVAVFSNGDELREPGEKLGPGEIINSNHYAICALIKNWGGKVRYLGCAADSEAEIEGYFKTAIAADIIIPVGGASVGDYDFVKTAFNAAGGEIAFENVAVRPGKPTWYGRLGAARIIGLPGNPASAIVTAALFVQPLVRRLSGLEKIEGRVGAACLTEPIKSNGSRESYLRAQVRVAPNGEVTVAPAMSQDSSLLSPFATANVLIRRRPNAPPASAGEEVEFVWLR